MKSGVVFYGDFSGKIMPRNNYFFSYAPTGHESFGNYLWAMQISSIALKGGNLIEPC